MSLPYHKPPPYERPNWSKLNEGQRRYAMEQYNLALVRRGAKFTPPSSDNEEEIEEDIRSIASEEDVIANLDAIDKLIDNIFSEGTNKEDTTGTSAETSSSGTQVHEGTSLPDNDSSQSSQRTSHTMSTPMDTTNQQPDTSQGSPAKQIRLARKPVTHSPSVLPGTSGNTDGMVGGVSGQAIEHSGVTNIPRGINTPTYTFRFKRLWKFLSFGVADVILTDTLTKGSAPISRWALTTSLVNVPWEYAFFYISPAEYARLQSFNGVFANRCRIRVTQYNPRVAFQTADTTSTQATLNQNKFTRIGIGLRENANLYGSDRDYKFNSTEPMKPDSFEDNTTGQTFRLALSQNMYGLSNNNNDFDKFVPTVVTGAEMNLTRYYTVYASKNPDTATGFPLYNNFCTEKNSMECLGKPVISEVHNFTYAPLRPRAHNAQQSVFLPGDTNLVDSLPETLPVTDGYNIEILKGKVLPANGTAAPGVITETNIPMFNLQSGAIAGATDTSNFSAANIYYKFPMEQAGIYQEMNSKRIHFDQQQSIHMGVRAVPKLGTAVNDILASSWLDTQMYWAVEAELEVHASDPFVYPLGDVRDIASRGQLVASAETADKKQVPLVTTLDLPTQYGRKRMVFNSFTK